MAVQGVGATALCIGDFSNIQGLTTSSGRTEGEKEVAHTCACWLACLSSRLSATPAEGNAATGAEGHFRTECTAASEGMQKHMHDINGLAHAVAMLAEPIPARLHTQSAHRRRCGPCSRCVRLAPTGA